MKSVFIITTIEIIDGNSAGAARLMNIAKALTMNNVHVYLCSSTLLSRSKINSVYDYSNDISIIITGKIQCSNILEDIFYRSTNFIRKMIFLYNLNNFINNISGQVIFYLYPNVDISLDIAALIYLKGIRDYNIYCDINELRVASIYNLSLSSNPIKFVIGLFKRSVLYIKFTIPQYLAKYYNGLVVISTNLEKYFAKYNDHMIRVPILSDLSNCQKDYISKFTYGETFRIGFAGIISIKKEGFEVLYKALEQVKDRYANVKLNLYGPFAQNEYLPLMEYLPIKYKIKENIKYHGIIDHNILINEFRKNHLLIIPRTLNLQTNYGFSTKLSEYLISGVPVLITDVSDNALYIQDGYNGFIVKPGDDSAMAEKILQIINNYSVWVNDITINAYETVEKYFWYKIYSEELVRFIS